MKTDSFMSVQSRLNGHPRTWATLDVESDNLILQVTATRKFDGWHWDSTWIFGVWLNVYDFRMLIDCCEDLGSVGRRFFVEAEFERLYQDEQKCQS